jgi:hypothetical protein
MKPIIITGAYGVGKSEFATQWALKTRPVRLGGLRHHQPVLPASGRNRLVGDARRDHCGIDAQASHQSGFPAFSGDISGVIAKGLPLIIDCAGSENGLKPLATFMDVLEGCGSLAGR